MAVAIVAVAVFFEMQVRAIRKRQNDMQRTLAEVHAFVQERQARRAQRVAGRMAGSA